MAGDRRDQSAAEYSSSPCYLHEFEQSNSPGEAPGSGAWADVRAWRREQRDRLRELRRRMPGPERTRADLAILEIVRDAKLLGATDAGIYWPQQAEFDSRPLMDDVLGAGGRVAIPVVVAPAVALEFWEWDGRAEVRPQGRWGIPAPPARQPMAPAVLIIPLIGFDGDGYSLGNGGGDFNRSLAAMSPRPATIGIGYELGRLDTVYPQDHDIRIDAIVTEQGIERHHR